MKSERRIIVSCAIVATTLGALMGSPSAALVSWDFTGVPASPSLGQSADFIGSDGVTSLNLQAFGPNQPELVGGLFDPGLGLTNSDGDNEIKPDSYIQVSIGGVFSSTLLSWQMGSIEQTETWGVYGSNTPGSNAGLPPGATLLASCMTLLPIVDCENRTVINSQGFSFLDITMLPFAVPGVGTNTGLFAEINGTINPVPAPIVGAGIPGLVAACTGLWGLSRRRRTAVG